jgi:hypothetical protein
MTRPHKISLKKCWRDKARARQIFPTGNILSQQCPGQYSTMPRDPPIKVAQ